MFLLRQTVKNLKQLAPGIKSMSSQDALVDLTVDNDGVAIMTLQRPPVNSLNLDMLKEISKSLDEVAKNKCRGMILTSSSPTVFSAGLDITEMYKPDLKRAEEFWTTLQEVWFKLFGSTFPTAAAINGLAPAGGCLLLMSCEYRAIVAGKFTIGFNEAALGIVAPKFFMDTVCQTIPIRQAEYAFTTARMFTVDEALKGRAPAAGCLLLMSCEYRVMVQGNFTIGLNESTLGMVAPKWFIDTMCHIISTREAEYALTTSRLFTADDALKVRLIDEIATDKSEAIAQCKTFIRKFENVPTSARAIVKQRIREAAIKNLRAARQAEILEFLDFVKDDEVQQNLEALMSKVSK